MIEQNVPSGPGGDIGGGAGDAGMMGDGSRAVAPANERGISEILGTMHTGISISRGLSSPLDSRFMLQPAPVLQSAASLVETGGAAAGAAAAATGAPAVGRQGSLGYSQIPIPNLGQHSRQSSGNAFWTAANAAAGGAFAN